MEPRVAAYARVSTNLQSAEMQLTALRRVCENRGWTEVEEFVDEGVSGAKSSRSGTGPDDDTGPARESSRT